MHKSSEKLKVPIFGQSSPSPAPFRIVIHCSKFYPGSLKRKMQWPWKFRFIENYKCGREIEFWILRIPWYNSFGQIVTLWLLSWSNVFLSVRFQSWRWPWEMLSLRGVVSTLLLIGIKSSVFWVRIFSDFSHFLKWLVGSWKKSPLTVPSVEMFSPSLRINLIIFFGEASLYYNGAQEELIFTLFLSFIIIFLRESKAHDPLGWYSIWEQGWIIDPDWTKMFWKWSNWCIIHSVRKVRDNYHPIFSFRSFWKFYWNCSVWLLIVANWTWLMKISWKNKLFKRLRFDS